MPSTPNAQRASLWRLDVVCSCEDRATLNQGLAPRQYANCMPTTLPACGGWETPGSHASSLPVSQTSEGMVSPCKVINGSKQCMLTCNPAALLNATALQRQNTSSTCLELFGTFSLDNVCVKYPSTRNTQADLIARDGQCATVHGYSEYRRHYVTISKLRPPLAGEIFDGCHRSPLGLGMRFSSNNFFHRTCSDHKPATLHKLQHARTVAFFRSMIPTDVGIPTYLFE